MFAAAEIRNQRLVESVQQFLSVRRKAKAAQPELVSGVVRVGCAACREVVSGRQLFDGGGAGGQGIGLALLHGLNRQVGVAARDAVAGNAGAGGIRRLHRTGDDRQSSLFLVGDIGQAA